MADVASVLAQDALKSGPQPYRFAVPTPVAINPATDGIWQVGADGMARWQLAVQAAAATSLNFGFTRFNLPPGATLSLHAADGSQASGPYGSEYNAQGQLWTPIVRGDTAVIELRVPAALRDAVQLTLGVVNQGFRGFGAKDSAEAKSGSCNIDVVCSDGNGWRNEIRSVARYTIGGVLLCTGSLVNNSRQDFTPYFLTANHCLSSAAEAATTVFYWNYQTSRCGGAPDGQLGQTQSGALFRTGSGGGTGSGSDFTLLELLSRPPASFRVHYAGWDRRDIAPLGVTSIHHPNGDEKRISMDFDQTYITAYGDVPGTVQSTLTPTHLMIVSWNRGVTEGGSSGGGLWNREHRLVGQLSGGSSECAAPDSPDWYGRMFSNFSATATPLNGLSRWLDPDGNVETLNGADPTTMTDNGGGAIPVNGSNGNGGTGSSSNTGGGGALGLSVSLSLLLFSALSRQRRWHRR